MLSQIFILATPLLTVRFTLDYLGPELYGLWVAVVSFFSILSFADLGLGNGMQSRLSRCKGANSVKIEIVSTSYFIVTVVTLVLLIVLLAIFPFVNWSGLLNTSQENTDLLILSLLIPKILAIPLSLIRRVQNAFQVSYIGNIYQIFSSLITLLIIYVVCKYDYGVYALFIAAGTVPILVDLANSVVYFIKNKLLIFLNSLDLSLCKELLSTGLMFFLLSILLTLGNGFDNFIVANTSGPEQAATYSILLRVTQLINVAVVVLSQPLWGVYGNALVNGEKEWVKNSLFKTVVLSVFICFTSSLILMLFGGNLFELWLGKKLVYSEFLFLGLLVFQVITAFVSPFFMVLNGAGKVRFQVCIFLIFTPVVLYLKYQSSAQFGISYIPWVGVLCYASLVVVPVCVAVYRVLSE